MEALAHLLHDTLNAGTVLAFAALGMAAQLRESYRLDVWGTA